MNKYIIQVNSKNCTGCHLCELACSSTKEGYYIPSQSRIRVVTNGLQGWSNPVVCLQCEDPLCMKACSSDAIYKAETPQGTPIVLIDKEKCIGCHQCVVACPFGAIEYFKDQKAIKCDLCNGSPACVEFCFYDCLKYVEISEEDYQERLRKIRTLTTKVCRDISKKELYRRRLIYSLDII